MTKSEQPQQRVKDAWDIGGSYDSFMGRWSRFVAADFLKWISVPTRSKWVDVGCGTGILSRSILASADPAEVRGIDQATGFISFAEKQIRDPRAHFEAGSAESLRLQSGLFDAVVSGLALNFIPNTDLAISEMRRVAKPGGVVALYVWDYADKMEFLRCFWDAAVALDPQASELDEGNRFPLCKPQRLREMFIAQGLFNVDVRSIDVQTRFVDFEDYWRPFLSGQGPAPSYVASLSAGQQSHLREKIRSRLPISTQGTIDLIARAWAVKGYV